MNIMDLSLRSVSNRAKSEIRKLIHNPERNRQWHSIESGLAKSKKIYVNKESFSGWSQMIAGTYDQDIYQHLIQFTDSIEKPIIFDIGAHFGYSTLCFASLENSIVHSFEPNPLNLELLNSHLQENGLNNVTVSDVALSNSIGEQEFVFSESVQGSESSGSHLGKATPPLNSKVYRNFKKMLVQTTTIDEYNKKHNVEPNILKIDVEGAESFVLQGAKDWFENESGPKMLLIEVHNIVAMHDTLKILYNYGFSTHVIDEDTSTTSRCFIQASRI